MGPTLTVRGHIEAAEDLVVAGRIDGPIWSDDASVTVAATATVSGDIVARDITVSGRVEGTLMATHRVAIVGDGEATGRVLAPEFVLEDGSFFKGTVEPHQLEAALQVARHRRRQLTDVSTSAPADPVTA